MELKTFWPAAAAADDCRPVPGTAYRAAALIKISGTIERVPQEDLRRAEGMSAFFIIPARSKKSLMNIFSDHPTLEKRLAALERYEAQLQQGAAA